MLWTSLPAGGELLSSPTIPARIKGTTESKTAAKRLNKGATTCMYMYSVFVSVPVSTLSPADKNVNLPTYETSSWKALQLLCTLQNLFSVLSSPFRFQPIFHAKRNPDHWRDGTRVPILGSIKLDVSLGSPFRGDCHSPQQSPHPRSRGTGAWTLNGFVVRQPHNQVLIENGFLTSAIKSAKSFIFKWTGKNWPSKWHTYVQQVLYLCHCKSQSDKQQPQCLPVGNGTPDRSLERSKCEKKSLFTDDEYNVFSPNSAALHCRLRTIYGPVQLLSASQDSIWWSTSLVSKRTQLLGNLDSEKQPHSFTWNLCKLRWEISLLSTCDLL